MFSETSDDDARAGENLGDRVLHCHRLAEKHTRGWVPTPGSRGGKAALINVGGQRAQFAGSRQF